MQPLAIVPVDQIPAAADVPTDNLLDIFRVCVQMEKICIDQNGIGLAAVQVGVPWKLFIVHRDKEGFEYYVNCEYTSLGEKQKAIEGCLSLRDAQGNLRRFEVERHSMVLLKGKQLKISDSPSLVLEDITKTEQGLYAVVIQHEIDHQRGILISDCGQEIEIS